MSTEKKSRAIFEAAIKEYAGPQLLGLGFERHRHSFFHRWSGDCHWRIWPFVRETRGADEAFLHMTVCVGFRKLTELLSRWEEPLQTLDVSQPCNMAADIIYLRPFVQAPMRITPTSSPERLGILLLQDIKNFALPFLKDVGSLEKAIAVWETGQFYNAGGLGTYLLASAYLLRGDKCKALDFVRNKIAEEEKQIGAGEGPIAGLNSAEIDLVARMDLRFGVMSKRELARLRSFETFLLNQQPPAIPVS